MNHNVYDCSNSVWEVQGLVEQVTEGECQCVSSNHLDRLIGAVQSVYNQHVALLSRLDNLYELKDEENEQMVLLRHELNKISFENAKMTQENNRLKQIIITQESIITQKDENLKDTMEKLKSINVCEKSYEDQNHYTTAFSENAALTSSENNQINSESSEDFFDAHGDVKAAVLEDNCLTIKVPTRPIPEINVKSKHVKDEPEDTLEHVTSLDFSLDYLVTEREPVLEESRDNESCKHEEDAPKNSTPKQTQPVSDGGVPVQDKPVDKVVSQSEQKSASKFNLFDTSPYSKTLHRRKIKRRMTFAVNNLKDDNIFYNKDTFPQTLEAYLQEKKTNEQKTQKKDAISDDVGHFL